jgi:hypothetical protein
MSLILAFISTPVNQLQADRLLANYKGNGVIPKAPLPQMPTTLRWREQNPKSGF